MNNALPDAMLKLRALSRRCLGLLMHLAVHTPEQAVHEPASSCTGCVHSERAHPIHLPPRTLCRAP